MTKNKNLKDATKSKVKDLWSCERCNINSTTKDRMVPCPRGGCDAEVIGRIETITHIRLFKKEESKLDQLDKDMDSNSI